MAFPLLGAIGGALFGSSAATAATIGAVGSLAGGLIDDKQNRKAQARQNAFNVSQNDPANIRAKFEAAGFNPLLGVQGWSPTQQTSFAPSGMGTAIAEAGGVAAQYLQNKAKEASEVTRLQQQNAKLSEMLRDKALRPIVGGIFGSGPLLKKPEEKEQFGPDPLVNLYSPAAGKWVSVHPGIAKRLELKSGDTIIAEDYEAFLGEVGSEIVNTPNAVNEFLGFGGMLNHPPPFQRPVVPARPVHDYPRPAPVNPFGYSSDSLNEMRKKFSSGRYRKKAY